MYNEEIMPPPDKEQAAEDDNFIQGGLQAVKNFNSTFTVDGERAKLEIGDENVTMPAMNQQAMPPATGTPINSAQFQALFPNDPTGAAIAMRNRRA